MSASRFAPAGLLATAAILLMLSVGCAHQKNTNPYRQWSEVEEVERVRMFSVILNHWFNDAESPREPLFDGQSNRIHFVRTPVTPDTLPRVKGYEVIFGADPFEDPDWDSLNHPHIVLVRSITMTKSGAIIMFNYWGADYHKPANIQYRVEWDDGNWAGPKLQILAM